MFEFQGSKLIQKEKWDGGEATFIHELPEKNKWKIVRQFQLSQFQFCNFVNYLIYADDDLRRCQMRAQLQARRLTAQLNTKSTVVDVIKHLRLLIYLCHLVQ